MGPLLSPLLLAPVAVLRLPPVVHSPLLQPLPVLLTVELPLLLVSQVACQLAQVVFALPPGRRTLLPLCLLHLSASFLRTILLVFHLERFPSVHPNDDLHGLEAQIIVLPWSQWRDS